MRFQKDRRWIGTERLACHKRVRMEKPELHLTPSL